MTHSLYTHKDLGIVNREEHPVYTETYRQSHFFLDSAQEWSILRLPGMKITNKSGVPQALVNAVSRDNYSRGRSQRSITQLIGSPRIAIMRERHDHEMESDVADSLWALLGKALHWVAEQGADKGTVAEERLFAEINGWTISGQIDLMVKGQNTVDICDYKLTSVYAYQSYKPEWERQLNCYAWLARSVKKLNVGKLQIVCLLRDWANSKKETTADYPASPIQVVPIPDWGLEEQERYVRGRVDAHQEAELLSQLEQELPECTESDRWVRGETWAVFKPKGKRATRVFDIEAEATALAATLEGSRVEHRSGVPIRCENNYCGVARWCTQYAKINEK